MDPEEPSSTSDASSLTAPSAIDFARVLLWARSHGPLAALALFVLYDGGMLTSVVGTLC
jgi:hypothetical protein